jgi:hypothetical protein
MDIEFEVTDADLETVLAPRRMQQTQVWTCFKPC